MKDKASSVKVELPHNNLTRGGPIPHEGSVKDFAQIGLQALE